jgi:lipoprotein-anchoring transpeptidase ErfK/SrfK
MHVGRMFHMLRGPARLSALALTLAVVSSCSEHRSDPLAGNLESSYAAVELQPAPAPEPMERSDTSGSVVARATVARIPAFRSPRAERPFATFQHPSPFGSPRVFLVRKAQGDWLEALLPMRPNGTTGWIRSRDVRLFEHPYRIHVELGERRLTVTRGDRVIDHKRVAVGTPDAPTPTGLFYTTVLAKPDDTNGPYGPFAYGLSAYSEVYQEFAGGDGQVAIHGTNAPWLLGQAVSHGCIRMSNGAISHLRRTLPLGTPVRITA